MSTEAAASWDAAYASGRYRHDSPVAFTRYIVSAARTANLRRGLYIGCGNGRNLIPLSDAGLDLIGLDISTRAIAQLRDRRPGAARLIVGGPA
jgi:SAM-dependent methyltransferase